MTTPAPNIPQSPHPPVSTFPSPAVSPGQPSMNIVDNGQIVEQHELFQTEFFLEQQSAHHINALKPCEVDSAPNIDQLQKECRTIWGLYLYLETGDLPLDRKRAHAIPYESNQFALLNGTLYHFFQPRVRKPKSDLGLIRQIVVP